LHKSLANTKAHGCLHTSLCISLHFKQILKIFMQNMTLKMLQIDVKTAKELMKQQCMKMEFAMERLQYCSF